MANQLTNQQIKEVFDQLPRNSETLHNKICDLAKVPRSNYNISSVYNKAKNVVLTLKRLKKHYGDNFRYKEYLRKIFCFPVSKMKRKNDDSTANTESKKFISKAFLDVQSLQKQCQHLKQQLEWKDEKIVQKSMITYQLTRKVNRQQQTILRLRRKNTDLSKQYNELKQQKEIRLNASTQCNTMSSIIADLKNEIDYLQANSDDTDNTDSLEEQNPDETIEFKTRQDSQGRPYNAHVRQIYYFMRSHNVGVEHIAPIVRFIFSKVNIDCNDLPSATTALSFDTEMGILSREQIKEKCIESNDLTMYRDATTKKGRHFYGLEISDQQSSYTIGLREVSDGRAETYLKSTNKVLEDIEKESEMSVLSKVTNFMTDRSATEEKTNKLLRDKSSNEITSFKCAVHPLLQFWEVCQKEITAIEKESKLKIGDSSKESATQQFLRFISKLFYKDGSGDPIMSLTYLQSKGISSLPIENARGTRFNTFFYNAAGTVYLGNHIISYLKESKCNLNFTQSFVLECLQNDIIMSICQALGMISKKITEPYWRAAADETQSVLYMNGIYNRMVAMLNDICKDPNLLYENSINLFETSVKCEDPVIECLFTANQECKPTTTSFIERFCSAIKKKCEHLFKDYLPGGKYHTVNDELVEKSKSCAPNNIKVERLMAKVDSYLRKAPNSNIENIENKIMFQNNKTELWIIDKNENEQENLVSLAMKRKKQTTLDNYMQKKVLQQERIAIINDRIKNKEKQTQKKEEKKEQIKKVLNEKGIWSSEEEVEGHLEKLKTKTDKTKALKTQINYFKDTEVITLEKDDKNLLQFSRKGKALSVKELQDNLIRLIELRTVEIDKKTNPFYNPQNVINKYIIHTWNDATTLEDTTWQGRIESYNNGKFEIKYWETEESGNDDIFELTVDELVDDYKEGSLKFKEDQQIEL